jgi:phage terminase Nu1 subunit (DNA packaging protein)
MAKKKPRSKRRAPPKVAPPAETSSALTLKQLARGAGVSERTLNTWVGRGCPRSSVAAIDAWKLDNVLPRKGGPRKDRDGAGDQSQIALQTRLNLAKASDAEESAKSKRLKRRLLQRKLMLITEGVREAGEIFTEVRAIIESIPDAVAKECPQQLRTRIYDVARNKITAAFKKLAALNSVGSADAA